jgi:NADH-quinone oxidoreductase subunit M
MLLYLFILPLIASVALAFSGKALSKFVALGFSLVTLVLTILFYTNFASDASFVAEWKQSWVAAQNLNFYLVADGFSIWLLLLTNFLMPLIILATFNKDMKRANVFYALVLFMQFGLNGVFLSWNGIQYYIFWELALLPIYFIVWLWSEEKDKAVRARTAFKFFIYTLAGSLFMLFGFMYLFTKATSLDLQDLYQVSLDSTEQIVLFACFFAAFAVKIPVFPFHTWQADTYRVAPTAGTMLLSGIMLKMGTYSLIRWLVPIFPEGTAFWTPYILVLCAIGIIYGAVIALKQDNLKNLLAYSSLSHVGLIAAGAFVLTQEGFNGSLAQMLAHGINVVGVFFIAEIVLSRTGQLSMDTLGGIRSVAPRFFTLSLIIVLASVALPTTNAFIGEFLLLFSLYQYNTWLAVIAGTSVIFGAVYMLRMVKKVFLGNVSNRTQSFTDLNWSETTVFVALIAVIFVLGLYPKMIFDTAQPVFESILQTASR